MSQVSRDERFFPEVVFETSRGLLTIDAEGVVVFASDLVENVLGDEPGAVVGERFTEYLPDGEATLNRIRDATDSRTGTGELRIDIQRAHERTVTAEAFVAETERDGERFFTLTLSPREFDRDEQTDERPMGQLLEQGGEPFFVFDPTDATIIDCNKQAQELLGRPIDTSRNRSVRDLVVTPSVFGSFLEDMRGASEGRREEFTVRTGEEETRSVELVATPIESDGEQYVFARARDVSDRNRLQAQRRRRTAALNTVQDGVAVLDETFEHLYANAVYTELLCDDASDVHGKRIDRFLEDDSVLEREIGPTLEREGRWQGPISPAEGNSSVGRLEAAFEGLEDGSIVVTVSDAGRTWREEPSEDRNRVDRLETLTEVNQRLDAAMDRETVAKACVETVADVFGYDLATLRLEADDELQPEGMTTPAETLVSENPGFELGLSDAGRAYRTGEPVVREQGSDAAASDLLATSVHLPVGNDGVLTAATTDGRSVPPARFDALSVLAGRVETALNRLTRQSREPHATIRSQHDARDGVAPATITRDIVGELLSVDSRDEVENRVCSQLAGTDRYAGAWIADVDPTGERVRLGDNEGVADELLASLEDAPLSTVADGAVETAVETSELTVLEESALFEGDHRRSTEVAPMDAVCVVPLKSGEKVFGFLAVHSAQSTGIDRPDQRSLSVLGETVSYVLSSIENERLVLSDEFVQLEFQVTDPSCLSVALSEKLDTKVSMKRTVQNTNDEHLSYVRVEDADPDAAIEAAESIGSVRACRVINDYEYGCLIEVTRPSSGAEVMMEFGATMRSAEAESGRGRLVLEAPHTVDVRSIVEAYQSYNPQSELLTKRRVDRPVRAADQLRADVEDELTEKQLSAVSAAYFSGYYDWPRESTAEEVADSMDISASTLHQHLRHAHKKLLSSVLETSFSRRL